MKRLIARCLLACLLVGGVVHAEPRKLPRLDIAALAASPSQLFVGGFDAGLWVMDRDDHVHHLQNAALDPHINALAWSPHEDALWVGTARGLARCLPASSACMRVGPSSPVHALLLRRDGSLVAGTDAGLVLISGSHWEQIGKKQGAPFRGVWALAESADGTLYVGATNGLFWRRTRPDELKGWHRASVLSGTLPDDWVTALLMQNDRLHVGTYKAGLVTFQTSRFELAFEAADDSLGYVNPAGVVALGDDELAVATMDGLRTGALGDTQLAETQARDITAIVPAWQGGYWVGTRKGLEWVRLSAV